MKKFSDRIGLTSSISEIQVNSMNIELRNTIWNFMHLLIGEPTFHSENWQKITKIFYLHYFRTPINDIPKMDLSCMRKLYDSYKSLPWYEVYNMLEVFIENFDVIQSDHKIDKIQIYLNFLLERELSGFRCFENKLIAISSEIEMSSIKTTLEMTSSDNLQNIRMHFEKALNLLSKKPDPDYHNSIKESISAVEGVCKILTKVESGGLKDALRILSEKIGIPIALKEGYEKIYGYTSGKDGIRHPMLSSRNIGYPEAKYMLVSCSAFTNYIIDNARIEKLL